MKESQGSSRMMRWGLACLMTLVGLIPQTLAGGSALNLARCEPAGVDGVVRCGTYTVLEDRAGGKGRTIPLNVMLISSLEGGDKAEPLFMLAGGPGGAATQLAPALGILFPDLRREFDIVLVDRRGTGGSNPLQCTFGDVQSRTRAFLQVDIDPQELRECLESLDADPRLYSTRDAADDLDDVRAALGLEKINLFGQSFGTREALVYARRHPDHVRTLVLQGVAPPELVLPSHVAVDAQAALDDLWADCGRDTACHEAYPSPEQKLRNVLAELSGRSVTVRTKHPFTQQPVELTVTRDIFTGGLRGLLYGNMFAQSIPFIVDEASRGNFEPFAAKALLFSEAMARTLHLGLYLSVICTEEIPFVSLEEANASARDTFHGDALVRHHVEACRDWPRGDLPDDSRRPVRVDVPALLISGGADPVTAPRWGEAAARDLPRSRHLVIPHAGHADAVGPCEVGIIAAFVRSGTLEGLDTGCSEKGRTRRFEVPAPQGAGTNSP